MKRMYPIVLDVIKENRSNDPDVIARNLRIRVHYRSLPKHLKGLLIKTPFSRDIVINSKIDINHKRLYRLILFQISKYVVIIKVFHCGHSKQITENIIFQNEFLTIF